MRDAVKVQGHKVKETEQAILWRVKKEVETDIEYEELWFPLSQVHSIHSDYIEVSRWIAIKKGVIEE